MSRSKINSYVWAILLAFSAVGCAQIGEPSTNQQLIIFAASSLSDAMDALVDDFKDVHPDIEVILHYASSSQLAAQLIEGAPADIYASANHIQMGHVVAAGLTDSQPVIFATNQLTICIPMENPGEIKSPRDLAKPGISLIIAAPQTPIRIYTEILIEKLGDADFQRAVYQNVVSEEVNVRQVVAKIALGEADAGVVYTSDLNLDIRGRLDRIEIPTEFNLTAEYPIAVISGSHPSELPQQFIDFILTETGQTVLAEWGFGPISPLVK